MCASALFFSGNCWSFYGHGKRFWFFFPPFSLRWNVVRCSAVLWHRTWRGRRGIIEFTRFHKLALAAFSKKNITKSAASLSLFVDAKTIANGEANQGHAKSHLIADCFFFFSGEEFKDDFSSSAGQRHFRLDFFASQRRFHCCCSCLIDGNLFSLPHNAQITSVSGQSRLTKR